MSFKLNSKVVVLLLVVMLIAGFFIFGLDQYFTLQYMQSQRQEFIRYFHDHQALTIAVYFVVYVAVTALSLPGAALMTIVAGAIFGLLIGTVVVSFASSIGATLAFLVTRFLLRDYVQEKAQQKFSDKLSAINKGIEKEGSFYLFTLRLIPVFPFFLINLLMALTPIKTRQFYLVSQVGMLAGTIVYVNAGSELASLHSLSGILSPSLLLSFALLGVFPLLAKKLVGFIKARKQRKSFVKPKQFHYNLAVIGAGSAGLVSAYIASAVRAKVALIEKHKMGGECLNTGCVPSKALLRTAGVLNTIKRAKEFGLKQAAAEFEFADVMQRVQSVIEKVAPHDSVERYTKLGVDCYQGEAKLLSPYEIQVNGETLTAKNIIIATGSQPFIPAIEGLESIEYLTSDTVWGLREQPKKMLVLGGGPIGCELAQAFQRLGSEVSIVERSAGILSREDGDVSRQVLRSFVNDSIKVFCNYQIVKFITDGDNKTAVCKHRQNGEELSLTFDRVLIALGRRANVAGFGLRELGVSITARGTLELDGFLRTNYDNIYACGDVAGPYQFTHTASHQAWYAAVNALFSPFKKFKVNYAVIPWATYTDPEVARVGLSETEAQQKNIPYEVTSYGLDDLDRAIVDSEDRGMVKVLTVPGKDKILGVTIVGAHAGDLIAEFVLAMSHGIGLNKLLGTIHIFPTMAEANKYVAGNWKKAHQPERLLRWVEKFHRWRRR